MPEGLRSISTASPYSSSIAKVLPCLSVRRLDAASDTTPGMKTVVATSPSRFTRRPSRRSVDRTQDRKRAAAPEGPVEREIVARHARSREALLEALAHAPAVDAAKALRGVHGLLDGLDDEAGDAVVHDLRHGAVAP